MLVTATAFPAAAQNRDAMIVPPEVDEEVPPGADEPAAVFESARVPDDPLRIVATLGGGASIRLIDDPLLGQQRFAPSFLDLAGGVVFPGRGLRHGALLQISTNISPDGNASTGYDPLQQWVLQPTYYAYLPVVDDLITLTGKVGLGFALSAAATGGPSYGFEIALGAQFQPIFAGLGLYAEASFSTWVGVSSSLFPIVSFEGGIVIDYEVLP